MSNGMHRLPIRVTPASQSVPGRGWNFNQLSIGFAFRLRLRAALPYVDQRSVGNLGLSACRILTGIDATHASILTSQRSTAPHGDASTRLGTLPYRGARWRASRSIGGVLEPRLFSVQEPSTSDLLRTL